jgi:signal transduction histidine kinase/CheY-like chemotaxis protein
MPHRREAEGVRFGEDQIEDEESQEPADHLLDGHYEVVDRWSASLTILMGTLLAVIPLWQGSKSTASLLWMVPGMILAIGQILLAPHLAGRIASAVVLYVQAAALHSEGLVEVTLGAAVTVFLVLYRDPRVIVPGAFLFWAAHASRLASTGQLWQTAGELALLAVIGATCTGLAYLLRQQLTIAERHRVERERMQAQVAAAMLERDRAERRKSEFLSNVSHEVRTPMHGVMAMTRLLLETRLTGEQRELAETLERSNRSLLDMLNEILDYSSLEAGVGLVEQPFVLADPVDDVLEFLGPVARNKGLELLWEWDPHLPLHARGDMRRLRQLLLNLIGNAVRVTESGYVRVTGSLEEDEAEEEIRMRIEVRDTGPGLTESEQASIFEPFSQGRGEVSRKYSGTGLNLVISKRVAERMGGSIVASSTPGRGASFWLSLPLRRVYLERHLDTTRLAAKRVLVLSRNEATAETLAAQVRQYGMIAAAAWFPDTAILELVRSKSQGQAYDLLAIDGDQDGWPAAVNWLKRVRAACTTPAVAILALGHEIPEEEAAQFATVLRKPLRIGQLPSHLEMMLGVRPAEPAPTSSDPLEAAQPPQEQQRRVLLVEDNRLNQRLGIRLLERLGYRVVAASDGREAIRAVAVEDFDAILMDCQMPEVDGYAATREIRAFERARNRHTPIIALTAYAVAGDRERCLEAGMDDYMTKPVILDQLQAMLERWIGKQGRERTTSASSGL